MFQVVKKTATTKHKILVISVIIIMKSSLLKLLCLVLVQVLLSSTVFCSVFIVSVTVSTSCTCMYFNKQGNYYEFFFK